MTCRTGRLYYVWMMFHWFFIDFLEANFHNFNSIKKHTSWQWKQTMKQEANLASSLSKSELPLLSFATSQTSVHSKSDKWKVNFENKRRHCLNKNITYLLHRHIRFVVIWIARMLFVRALISVVDVYHQSCNRPGHWGIYSSNLTNISLGKPFKSVSSSELLYFSNSESFLHMIVQKFQRKQSQLVK